MVMDQFFTKENLDRYFAEGQSLLLESFDFEKAVDRLDYDRIYDTVKTEILSSKLGAMLGMFGGDGMFERYRDPFKIRIREYILIEITSPDFFSTIAASGVITSYSIHYTKLYEFLTIQSGNCPNPIPSNTARYSISISSVLKTTFSG